MSASDFAPPGRLIETDGPFAGWWTWSRGADRFETMAGPFYYRLDERGRAQSAFQPRADHCNVSGALHGGLLMTFADFTLFALAHHELGEASAVTLSCTTDFVSAGLPGPIVAGEGEVIRATKSLIFVRGALVQTDKPVASFSGILKKLHPRTG